MFSGESLFSSNILKDVLLFLLAVAILALLGAFLMLWLSERNRKKRQAETNAQYIWEGPGVLVFGLVNPYEWFAIDRNYVYGEKGIYGKTIIKIPLTRISAIQAYKSPLGMALGYGTLQFATLGRDIPDLFMTVKNPDKVLDIATGLKANAEKNAPYRGKRNNRSKNSTSTRKE